MRPGFRYTVAAVTMAAATAIIIAMTASEAETAVKPLVITSVALLALFVVIGSNRWVGTASLPMLGAVVLEAGFAERPSWIRSILLGCLWFATMEMAWEAIDRRRGARHARAINVRRAQEVVTVVGLTLTVGLIATATVSAAPARSVLLQALVLGGLLSAFVVLVRQAAATQK